MIENYMDYSDDRCLNLFTKEQVGIMRAMLQTSRAGIVRTDTVSTGISVKNELETVQLFPNPTKGVFTISMKAKNSLTYTCEIYNALGERVFSKIGLPSSFHEQINLSTYSTGIYFVKIYSKENFVVKRVELSN
jgi:hypothetical protein